MIRAHLLLPTEVIERIKEVFSLRHENGHFGYFADLLIDEFWALARQLVESGYRIDITPGDSFRLMAKK